MYTSFLDHSLIFIGIGFSFFPCIIFLDYHKKEDVHLSVIYLVLFYSCLYLLVPILLGFAIKRLYVLLIVPIFIFGIAIRSTKDKDIES